eukprot:TRINITY_DN1118_c0_g1_i2.p1 TRINITY_DN1118_c0_g1~~TRINITY_DN1118_c0_g1_i2.p1  ORF type:complete len:289 (+),score=66.08 TRINITY_DN1118_c0_g1_i2:161-1027(+)
MQRGLVGSEMCIRDRVSTQSTWGGTLVALSDMNTPRSRHCLVAPEGKTLLYALGGENATGVLRKCEYYDTKENKWEMGPELNEGRCSFSACVMGSSIYAVGGWNKDYLNSIERLNINSTFPEWQNLKIKKNALPPLQIPGLCGLNDHELLIFGGFKAMEEASTKTMILDTESLELKFKKDLEKGDGFVSSEVQKFEDKIYAFGYEKGGVHIFDHSQKDWKYLSQSALAKKTIQLTIILKKKKTVSYTHLRAHETSLHLVCRLLLEKKKKKKITTNQKTQRNTLSRTIQ